MQTHGSHDMQKAWLLLLLLWTVVYAAESDMESFSYAHEVKVLVSDTEIVAGNVIRFKIRATGDKVVFPNIEEIDGVPVLDQQERVTNMFHYVNGVLKKERTTLILTFAPHHDMTIPSYDIKIDGKFYKSKPVHIKVMPATAENIENGNKFFLHLEADKKEAIVGEPIIVTVFFSLKIGVRLSENPEYTKPSFKGFFARQIGDEKVYNEGNRQVTEIKYLLTPQYDGEFKVGPARAKMPVVNKKRRDMFGRFTNTRWVPIASNRVKIEVKKKPQGSDLVGRFTIENILDAQKVEANKPVNLTVKIEGDGILEDYQFPEYEIDGVTVYSDEAEIETEIREQTFHSTYTKRFAFIADHDFTIPARRISVYDFESKTLKYLDIPAYEISVEGVKGVVLPTSHTTIPRSGTVHSNLNVPQKSMLDFDGEINLIEVKSLPWKMVLLAFLFGMFVMFLFKYTASLKWKRGRKHISDEDAFNILYKHINASGETEEMVRQLYAKRNGDSSIVIDQERLKKLVEQYET